MQQYIGSTAAFASASASPIASAAAATLPAVSVATAALELIHRSREPGIELLRRLPLAAVAPNSRFLAVALLGGMTASARTRSAISRIVTSWKAPMRSHSSGSASKSFA